MLRKVDQHDLQRILAQEVEDLRPSEKLWRRIEERSVGSVKARRTFLMRGIVGLGLAATAATAFMAIAPWRNPSSTTPGEMAQTSPGNVSSRPLQPIPPEPIETMAAESTLVVRGVAQTALRTWNLKADEDPSSGIIMPVTDYEVSVTQYMKGSGPSTLVVTLIGGPYEGGHEVEEVDVGKEYLFFIRPYAGRSQFTPDGKQRYEEASIFGVMEIRDGMVIRSGLPRTAQQLPLAEVEKKVE